MDSYVKSISVDVNAEENYTMVKAKQGDKINRKIAITLKKDGENFTPSGVSEIWFRVEKPDKNVVIVKSTDSGSPISVNGNVYTVDLTEQCLTASGEAWCDLAFLDSAGNTLSSAAFVMKIIPMPNGDSARSSSAWTDLQNAIDNIESIVQEQLQPAIDDAERFADILAFRVSNGYIQYTVDSETWINLMPSSSVGSPDSNTVPNRSEVSGETVSQALNWLKNNGGGGTSDEIANESTVTGQTVTQALNWLKNNGGGGTSDEIANESTVTGQTVTDALDNLGTDKAPLDSPAFTGTPTSPTPESTDDSTKIATTAFIKALLSALSSGDIDDDSDAGGATVKASLSLLNGSLNTIVPLDTTPTSGSTKGVTSDGVHKALNTHARPNLLDNWYFVGGGSQQGNSQFPINQRGQTIYNATSREWTVDRWNKRLDSSLAIFSVTIGQDGLVLDSSGSSENEVLHGIVQPIENPDALLGKTLTLSILIKDFDTSKEAVEVGLYGSPNGLNQTDLYGRIQNIKADGLYTTVINMPTSYKQSNNSHLDVALFRSLPFKCTVVAIKLEVGEGQTLAHKENNQWVLNEIPDFQEQLYKCNTNAAYSSPSDEYSHKTNAYVDDTGWVDLELTPQFTKYSNVNGARLRYRKIGNVVAIRGVLKPTSEIAAGSIEIAVSTIPESIRPDYQITMLQQGSAKNSFITSVATNGTLSISRYGATEFISIPTSAWLNIYVVYMI